jgi:hypothetical protein
LIRFSHRTAFAWLGLAGILLLYIAFITHLHPINLFGIAQDDSIYFSSAKAIAEGRGYILPSLPGEPQAANKYPILYPWMLSWIWRWNPSFPANVNGAVALTAAFGLVYIAFAFVFFSKSMGIRYLEALLLTAFCAFHPVILYYSASVFSDIPFAALSLGSLVVADRATKRDGTIVAGVSCGVLAGLSILMRTAGYPIVLGILITAILRKAWRQTAVFGSTIATFLAFLIWEKLSTVKDSLPAGWSTFGPGFRQTWLYYTDYLGFRKLSVVNPHLAGTVLLNQILYLCTELPSYFLSPFFNRNIPLLFILTVALLWLISNGLVLTVKLDRVKPIHFALLLYAGLILAWNYPEWDRFLIPFLPLFAASLWLEARWIAGELSRTLRVDRPLATRLSAGAMGAALAALALGILWNAVTNRDRRDLQAISHTRAALLVDKNQAYDWIRHNSPNNSRIVAGEDGSVYLYTGRQSMAFIALLPVGIYEPHRMQSDLNHITDVGAAIGAAYWLASSDDSDKQWTAAKAPLAARLNEVEGVLPMLFRSSSGTVRIYSLGCLQNRQGPSCRSAGYVLFPEKR